MNINLKSGAGTALLFAAFRYAKERDTEPPETGRLLLRRWHGCAMQTTWLSTTPANTCMRPTPIRPFATEFVLFWAQTKST